MAKQKKQQPKQKMKRTQNKGKRLRDEEYRQLKELLFKTYFKKCHIIRAEIMVQMLLAIRRLRIPESSLRSTIMRQGEPDADKLLARLAADVLERNCPSVIPELFTESGADKNGIVRPKKHGLYKNDCCQTCGMHLERVCYSKNVTNGQVPRTNKICPRCFDYLPLVEQPYYHKYNYAIKNPAIKGVHIHRSVISAGFFR